MPHTRVWTRAVNASAGCSHASGLSMKRWHSSSIERSHAAAYVMTTQADGCSDSLIITRVFLSAHMSVQYWFISSSVTKTHTLSFTLCTRLFSNLCFEMELKAALNASIHKQKGIDRTNRLPKILQWQGRLRVFAVYLLQESSRRSRTIVGLMHIAS